MPRTMEAAEGVHQKVMTTSGTAEMRDGRWARDGKAGQQGGWSDNLQ